MAVNSDRYSASRNMELRDYLSLFSRRKWVLVLSLVTVSGAALAASYLQSPVYQATSRLFLVATSSVFEADQQLSAVRIQTEIQVIQSSPVRDAVRAKLGNPPPVSAVQLASTEVLEVRVKADTPERAAAYTDAYIEAYTDYRRKQAVDDLVAKATEIQRVLDDLKLRIAALDQAAAAVPRPNDGPAVVPSNPERDALISQQALFKQKIDQLSVDSALRNGNFRVVADADVPTTPISPNPRRNAILGLGLGLVLGVAVAMVVEHLDDSIKTKEDLERAAPGLAVVGMIPVVPTWKNKAEARVISQAEPSSPAAEAYRSLRTSINFLGVDRTMRVVQITSPNASEGKTAMTANLAVALARAGEQVVIVNCDLRRPRIHAFFDLAPFVGFTNVLLGELPLADALQAVPGERNLRLLAAGKLPPNPSELLSSGRTKQLLDALKAQGAMVLIDCPPVLPVTDAAVLSSRVDATILVALAGSTTGKHMARAMELLGQVGAPIIGTVLNGVSIESGYGFQYGYSAEGHWGSSTGRAKPPAKDVVATTKKKPSAKKAVIEPGTNGRKAPPPGATRTKASGPAAPGRVAPAGEGSRSRPGDGRTGDGRTGDGPNGAGVS